MSKGFYPELDKGRLWKISKDFAGRMPDALSGRFTSQKDAQNAINLFQNAVQAKVKPTRAQLREKAKEKLNG